MKYQFKNWDIQPGDSVFVDCSCDNSHDTTLEMEIFNGHWLTANRLRDSRYFSKYDKYQCGLPEGYRVLTLPSGNMRRGQVAHPDRWTWGSQHFSAVSRDGKLIYDERLNSQEQQAKLQKAQLPQF